LIEKITKLNRGAKQKVAILRALLSQPDIFVADEPTSALDKESAQKIFNLLNFMNTRKKTTIIWAHTQ
jgi:ABC-type lipoprotein export system ATPase subunit